MSGYNPLYTNRYQYTQPPGDVRAQVYGGVGQGTRGSYFPLQGIGAGIHMARSTMDNQIKKPIFPGKIGGAPNYEDKPMTTEWIGFNSFPETNSNRITNSYLITGANQRVCNPGQQCPGNMPCSKFWPGAEKAKGNYCLQASDLLLVNPNKFTRIKQEPQYERVLRAY